MEITIELYEEIIDELIRKKLVKSRNDFKRLKEQGGVSIMIEQLIIKIGKRKFIRFVCQ